jgi:hypothetical protein
LVVDRDATTEDEMTRYSVKVWERGDDNYGTPGDSVDVEAANEKEARRAAARLLGLRPHQWALENSPLYLDAAREEGNG